MAVVDLYKVGTTRTKVLNGMAQRISVGSGDGQASWIDYQTSRRGPDGAVRTVLLTESVPTRALLPLMQFEHEGVGLDFRVLHSGSTPIKQPKILSIAADYQACTTLMPFVNGAFNGEVFALMPALREYFSVSAGINNLDPESAVAKGLVVANSDGSLTDAVTETAWGHILNLFYGVTDAVSEIPVQGRPTLENAMLAVRMMHADPETFKDNVAAYRQFLFATFLTQTLRMRAALDMVKRGGFDGCAMGETDAVYHRQIKQNPDLGIISRLGILYSKDDTHKDPFQLADAKRIQSMAIAFGMGEINLINVEDEGWQSLLSVKGAENYLIRIPGSRPLYPENVQQIYADGTMLIDPGTLYVNRKHDGLFARSMTRTRVGLLGVGKIGSGIARIGYDAFGTDLLGYDVKISDPAAEIFRARGGRFTSSMQDLVAQAQYAVIAMNLIPGVNNGVINASVLDAAMPGMRLVNIARGGLWVEPDVEAWLERDQDAALGSDVVGNETDPFPVNEGLGAFMASGRAKITPHDASAVLQVRENLVTNSVNCNLIPAIRGEQPKYLKDLTAKP